MTITIDILSLILGLILGAGFMGVVVIFLYFDDKWDTAFGKGWACGSEYQKKEQNKADAQLEKMRGKWKEHKDYPNLAYLCSECDYFTTMRSHFCPNCGADMRGDNNG